MSWFEFNGISSRNLPLIITRTPLRPSWAEEKNEITIPGRASTKKIGSGTYPNQPITIYAVITDTSPEQLRSVYNAIHGYGKLVLSTNPNEYILCEAEVLTPESVALTMAEIEIIFDCYPFAHAINPAVVDVLSDYTDVVNNGTEYSEPIIEIKVSKDSAPLLKGDVNFDGIVDATDASLVMAEYARIQTGGSPTFTDAQREAADMDNDGIIDMTDASAILQKYAESQTSGSGNRSEAIPAKEVTLYTNGEIMVIGLPSAVVENGFTVYIDSAEKLLYYVNSDGEKINILYMSIGNFPLLHTGSNYIKYNGDCDSVKVTVNERWI